jgi:hypothetical protein
MLKSYLFSPIVYMLISFFFLPLNGSAQEAESEQLKADQ